MITNWTALRDGDWPDDKAIAEVNEWISGRCEDDYEDAAAVGPIIGIYEKETGN